MKKVISIILACIMVSGVLVGCVETTYSEIPSPQSSETSSNALTLEPTQEPPIDEFEAKMPIPDFLDEEQQNLYRRAFIIYPALVVVPDSLSDGFPLKDGTKPDLTSEWIEVDGQKQHVVEGRYKNWNDFEAMLNNVFTKKYSNELMECGTDLITFINANGNLHFINGGDGGNVLGVPEYEDFELVSKTDYEIKFYVICHYTDQHEGETDEDYAKRVDSRDGFDRTEKFPITMVKTDNGWRFSEFHITF